MPAEIALRQRGAPDVTARVGSASAAALASLFEAEREYLYRCYVLPVAPRGDARLPYAHAQAIRRIARVNRRAGRLPTLRALFVPSAAWRAALDGIIIRVAPGRGPGARALALAVDRTYVRLDPRAGLWVVGLGGGGQGEASPLPEDPRTYVREEDLPA